MSTDARRFTRIRFRVSAVVETADERFEGSIKDLSMRGMFLYTGRRLPLGKKVEIRLVLPQTEITIAFQGVVCRACDEGLAFQFEATDLESYIHLRNIISCNTPHGLAEIRREMASAHRRW